MCNLSQGIKEDGIAIGRAEGVAQVILSMHQKGFATEQIAEITEKSIEEVEAIIAERELTLAQG